MAKFGFVYEETSPPLSGEARERHRRNQYKAWRYWHDPAFREKKKANTKRHKAAQRGAMCARVGERTRVYLDGRMDGLRGLLGWGPVPVYRVKAPSRIVSSVSVDTVYTQHPHTPENP